MAFFMASRKSRLPTLRARKSWATIASTTGKSQSSVKQIPGSTTSRRATRRANAIPTSGRRSKTLCVSACSRSPAPRRPFLCLREWTKAHLGLHLSQQDVVDQARRPDERGNRGQRAIGYIFNLIKRVRVYDLEVVETQGAFRGEFRSPGRCEL